MFHETVCVSLDLCVHSAGKKRMCSVGTYEDHLGDSDEASAALYFCDLFVKFVAFSSADLKFQSHTPTGLSRWVVAYLDAMAGSPAPQSSAQPTRCMRRMAWPGAHGTRSATLTLPPTSYCPCVLR